MTFAVMLEEKQNLKEGFFALVRSSFFQRAAGTYGTQMLMAVVSLVTSLIIARALGPAGRGEYAVAMAVGVIGVQFAHLGLSSSNSYLVSKDSSLLPSLLSNSLLMSFFLGGISAGALGLFFHLYPAYAPTRGLLLGLALLWVPFGTGYLLVVNLLMGIQEVRLYNLIELLNKVLATVFVIVAVWVGSRSPERLFLCVLLSLLMCFLLAFKTLRKFCHAPPRSSVNLFLANLKLAWKVYLCCIFSFLVIRIDLVMVKTMLGAAAAGHYSVAGTLSDSLYLLPTAVGAVLFPRLSAMVDDRQKWSLTLNALFGSGVILIALLAALGLSVRFVIRILFGKAFAPAGTAFLLLAPGTLFIGLETVLVQYVNSRGFPAILVVLWLITAIANVGANLWAIPSYGINGAAAVSSVSYLLALLGVASIAYVHRGIARSADRNSTGREPGHDRTSK